MTAIDAQPKSSYLTRLILTVMQVSKAVQTTLSARVEERFGISVAESDLLVTLYHAPHGALRMGHISEALITNPVTVTRLVDGLEAKGLVERQRSANDRRAVNAVITPAGRAKIRKAAPLMEVEFGGELSEVISEEEADALCAGLAKILGRLGSGPSHCEAPSETSPPESAS